MTHLQDAAEAPYPPAPWKCSGQMWTGIFKSTVPRQLPSDLKHLFDPHWFTTSLICYLDGTLRYDELIFGTPARSGPRLGLHVDEIWVNDLASLWGGRRIWGLPKNLAHFHWDGSTVQIADDLGLVTRISMDMRQAYFPWLWTPLPGFGNLDGLRTYYMGSLWLRPGKAEMQILEWPLRFPALQSNQPILGLGGKPFVLQVPPPAILKSGGIRA